MLAALIEKFPFVIAIAVLYLQSRVGWQMVAAAAIDGFWGVMFIVSYLKTRTAQSTS
jgi:drug/metabolite transporter (DMT)-like permease